MKIDLTEAMNDIMTTYESAYHLILEKYEVSDITLLSPEVQEAALNEVDAIVFKQEKEDEEKVAAEEKLKESLLEAASVINSFAEKSGKSIAEVEASWKEAKKIADEQGYDEPEYVVGVLKKMLKISESVKREALLAESLNEAKFVYDEKDITERLKKDGYYDSFVALKAKLKPTHSIVIEIDNDDKIVGIAMMPKVEYTKFARNSKYWEDANVKIYEAIEEYEPVEYYDMDNEFDCSQSKIVALNALAMATQVHLFHLNTVSYAEHMAFKDFYESMEDLTDELIEKLLSMGYDLTLDGETIRTFTFALTNDSVDAAIRGFRDVISEGIESTQDGDYASINDVMIDMQKKVDELLYKLTLK